MSNQIKEMSRSNVNKITAAMDAALEKVASELGLVYENNAGCFDTINKTFKPNVIFSC